MSDRLTNDQVLHLLDACAGYPASDVTSPAPLRVGEAVSVLDELLTLRRVSDEVVSELAAERDALRARVAELEAPGESASIHKLRAMVREAARLGWEDGYFMMSGGDIARADAIADRLLRGEHGGPDAD